MKISIHRLERWDGENRPPGIKRWMLISYMSHCPDQVKTLRAQWKLRL